MAVLKRMVGGQFERLDRFDAMLKGLRFIGPELRLYVHDAKALGEVVVLVWQEGHEPVEAGRPSFTSSGSVDRAFGSLKSWLASQGWIES